MDDLRQTEHPPIKIHHLSSIKQNQFYKSWILKILTQKQPKEAQILINKHNLNNNLSFQFNPWKWGYN
jgi:hypothetical protein